jgi:hypothetical protein
MAEESAFMDMAARNESQTLAAHDAGNDGLSERLDPQVIDREIHPVLPPHCRAMPAQSGRRESKWEVRSMPRRLATLAATAALMLAFAFSASPASASPVLHLSFPYDYVNPDGSLAFPPVVCSHHTYTFTSGTFKWVGRDVSAAHFTSIDAWATDEELTPYKVVGGETYSDPSRLEVKMMFVSQGGGVADSINVVGRANPNGGFFFDQGTCAY